ncbi:MAG: PAS domain-containing protein, partial [Gemmatimonadota bacterium]|nr:PAS domain-containing protein [Gemmatimonadota bacterium]
MRLRLALEAARAGAWEWEIDSDRTFWSPENYALMGLPAGSGWASYDDWLACVHPDDRERAQAEVAKAVEEKGDLDFEYRVVWPDETVRLLRDIGKMMLDEHGSPIGMYGIQIDVTEQRSLEDRLSRSQRMEAMGRVAGSVAHDFNNLLTVIAGNSELLETDPLLHVDLIPMVEEILRASQRAAALTQRLLAFGRRQVLSAQVLDLNRVINDMESLLRRTLGEDIDVTIRLAPDLGCVWADPGQLEQVLLNLIVNARDAMPSGGRLSVETYEADGGLL